MSPRSGGAVPPLVLAFDTAGPEGSVALGRGDEILASVVLDRQREHAARLIPAIEHTLAEARVDRSELDGVVVGEGPGSFTGVRVTAATAKGLVRALGVPLWAVSSLAATALSIETHAVRYVLFDARSDRVYGACYAVERGGVRELVAPHAATLTGVLTGNVPSTAVFCGDGAGRHAGELRAAGFPVADGSVVRQTSAVGLLAYLRARPELDPVAHPRSWEPRYVRAAGAEPPWRA